MALVLGPKAAYVAGQIEAQTWPLGELAARVTSLETRMAPRWVIWSAGAALRPIIGSGCAVARTWDLAEAHRLIHGGWQASPGHVWAACHGLPKAEVPAPRRHAAGFDGDLFDAIDSDDPGDGPFDAHGQLRADALTTWPDRPSRLAQLADAVMECQALQERSLERIAGAHAQRMTRTIWSESAAAVLCLELERDGLPVDRLAAEDLIGASAGPRPTDDTEAAAIRTRRDRRVLTHAPGRERTDLRNPGQVRDLLLSVGVDVPNTRAWVLEPYRTTHPLVDALLTWRKDERVATTYGYRWLDSHVGPDDRLRGAWSACDGAAGRMTAQNGLHNLPVPLRPAVCAAPGHLFVRADLGQIEPRVLAVVSLDATFAEATTADDLYAPVAAKLGVDRPRAKIAVLAAMYGQRSGAAGQALKDLERAYPVAMALLDRAYADGVARRPVRTWGGRLIRFDAPPVDLTAGSGEASPAAESARSGLRAPSDWSRGRQGRDGGGGGGGGDSTVKADAADAARGRFARNAVIQGSAAELFKAWAATVRPAVAPLGGRIVLCLHDELLVHVPQAKAAEAAAAVTQSLTVAAHTWSGTDRVRFVADTSVIRRWSEAKD